MIIIVRTNLKFKLVFKKSYIRPLLAEIEQLTWYPRDEFKWPQYTKRS